MLKCYTLKGKIIEVEPDMVAWSRWLETENRHVAREQIDSCLISTIFLGIDHNSAPAGQPVLFETLIFADADLADSVWSSRCCTYDEALAMHERARQFALASKAKVDAALKQPKRT
jgi:hypothetical protein